MALTKSRTSLYSGQTLTAGAGNTTSGTQDLSASYGTAVDIKLTNGATGPTVPAQVQIEVAADAGGTLFVAYGGPLVGGVTNNGVYSWAVQIPKEWAAFRTVAGSNTGQNVAMDVDFDRVTGL